MDLIKKFVSLLWVNFLWLLCCIPVLTAGASTCAAFAVTLRLADDDEEVQSFRGISCRFFKAFRQDLIQGFLILLFTVITFGLGGFFVYLAWDDGLNLIKIGLLAVYFLVVLVLNFYSYPSLKDLIAEILFAFERHSNLKQLILFKGSRLVSVERDLFESTHFEKQFKMIWNIKK